MPYKDPEKARENARERGKRYRKRHPERARAKKRAYYRRVRAEDADRFRAYAETFKTRHPGYFAAKMRDSYYHARLAVFEAIGNVCVGCGWDDVRVLEFDHLGDDGAEDRQRFAGMRSMYVYYAQHLEEAKAKLQPLCCNCNRLKDWLRRRS